MTIPLASYKLPSGENIPVQFVQIIPYVLTIIVLAGFIPDSLMKIGLVEMGQRESFPPILHVHAVLMGSEGPA